MDRIRNFRFFHYLTRLGLVFIVGFTSCKPASKPVEKPIEISQPDPWDSIRHATDSWVVQRYLEANPQTATFDTAVALFFQLQEKQRFNAPPPPPMDCFRNCMELRLNQRGEVLADGTLIPLDSIHSRALKFIQNENHSENLPEFKIIEDAEGKTRNCSKANFWILLNTQATQSGLQEIVVAVREAFSSYKQQLSQEWYQRAYAQLEASHKNHLDSLFAIRLFFFDLNSLEARNPPSVSDEPAKISNQ